MQNLIMMLPTPHEGGEIGDKYVPHNVTYNRPEWIDERYDGKQGRSILGTALSNENVWDTQDAFIVVTGVSSIKTYNKHHEKKNEPEHIIDDIRVKILYFRLSDGVDGELIYDDFDNLVEKGSEFSITLNDEEIGELKESVNRVRIQ